MQKPNLTKIEANRQEVYSQIHKSIKNKFHLEQELLNKKRHDLFHLSFNDSRARTSYIHKADCELNDINNKIQEANNRRSMNIFSAYLSVLSNNIMIESTHVRRKEAELTESLSSKESIAKFLSKCNKDELNADENKIKKTIEKCIKIQMKSIPSAKDEENLHINNDLNLSS